MCAILLWMLLFKEPNMDEQNNEKMQEIDIEICYALENKQQRLFLKIPLGSCVSDALEKSQVFEKWHLDVKINKVGIFGKLVKMDCLLRENDRIEIYRPLIADPKEVRKKRAESGKIMKKGTSNVPTEE